MARQEITGFEETRMLWRGGGWVRRREVKSRCLVRLMPSLGYGGVGRLEPVAVAAIHDVGRWRA